jgi:CheY-like chemotaxis protein
MTKILVIDDEKNLRETLSELLTHGGFEVYLEKMESKESKKLSKQNQI